MFCVPDMFKFMFPPVFHAIWQMLTEAAKKTTGIARFAIGIPRGFGKTVLLKLLVIWIILFTHRKFILIVCNTHPLAENFIADVCDVMNSINFLRVFGDWRMTAEMERQELKKFTFRGRPIILAGLGQGGSPRGLNIKYVRPDVIIMDDMQSREQAKSQTEADSVLQWMMATLLKAADKINCLTIFVGNKYPYEGTILKKLEHNSMWTSFVTGAILDDGESIWPELQSVDAILDELSHDMDMGHPEIFFSEVMNDDVAGSRSGLDFSKVNIWRDDPHKPQFASAGAVIIDPSAAKKKSDNVAIGAMLVYDTEPVLREVRAGKFNPGQTINEAISLAAKYGLSAIVIEDVAYQSTLKFWMDLRLAQLGLTNSIKVLLINPEGESKSSRILQLFKQMTAAIERVWVHQDARTELLHEAVYYDPLKTKNKDDVLDIAAYMQKVIVKFKWEILIAIDMLADHSSSSHEADLALPF
jgi:hypothetical protein